MPIDSEHPDFVTALERGLTVIRCFERGAEQLTLSAIAERTGLTRGTARRFLLTLEAIGYVALEDNRFRLLPRVLDLGYAYLSSLPLWEVAQPFMKNIVDRIDESCSLGLLDGQDIVYIARVPPAHLYTIPIQVGQRMPAFVNAMGRVLLAELDDQALDDFLENAVITRINERTVTDRAKLRRLIRHAGKEGYAMPEHENFEGRRALAVPIRNRNGTAIAALNVSALMSRASKADFLEKFLPLLQDAAKGIGRAL